VIVKFDAGWLDKIRAFCLSKNEPLPNSYGAAIRRAAKRAVEQGLSPIPYRHGRSDVANIRLLASESWLDDAKAKSNFDDDGELLLALANSLIAEQTSNTKTLVHEQTKERFFPIPGMEPREQQIKLANFLTHEKGGKPYRMCEASTGIGKGISLIVAALQTKQNHPTKQVVIAAPTLAILEQLYESYSLIKAIFTLDYKVVKTQSTAEFLSKRLALFWCEEYPEHPQREAFYNAVCNTKTYSINHFEKFNDVPLKELTVFNDSSTSDPGYLEFEATKSDMASADIVFCTHSMMALSAKVSLRATGDLRLPYEEYEVLRDKAYTLEQVHLPYYVFDNRRRIDSAPKKASGFFAERPFYFIDEAHLLSDMIRLLNSDSVSLVKLSKAVSAFKKKSAEDVQKAIEALIKNMPVDKDKPIPLRGSKRNWLLSRHEQTLSECVASFVKSYSTKTLEKTINGRYILRCAQLLKTFSKDNFSVQLSASKVRKYISIQSGSNSVKVIADFIAYSSSGISFTSATIHVPSSNALLNGYSYLARQLSLPFDMVETHEPMVSSWLTENVTLFTVPPAERFNPDSPDFPEVSANIINSLVKDEQIVGGTMVLCTSYQQIDTIAKKLNSGKVIQQKPGQSVRSLANKYLAAYRAGKKPVWVATGSAWTGIDITDFEVAAEDDNAIQQLIIVRLPFEQVVNTESANFYDVVSRCLFRLKQGIGRLVRRPGRTNMRIAILDGRLYSPQHKYDGIKDYLKDNYHQHKWEDVG